MYIHFKSLKFKNILSYGNQLTEIEFSKGLNLLSGKNGEGKSTILDALSFCLHGQPYRKIKINDLINRKNKGKLYTECSFSIDNREYCITRTLAPNKIKIEENGKELDLLSSKKLTQEEINKIIGIDSNLFRQVICLAVNYNKPYLSLPSMEKRDIAESIFNIKVFGDMLKILKKNSSGLKVQSEINKKSISLMESNLVSIRKQIKNFKSALKDFEKNKTSDLNEVNLKIKSFEKEIDESKSFVTDLNDQLMNNTLFDENDYQKELHVTEKNLNVELYKIKKAREDVAFLESNDVCLFCKTILTEDHRKKEINNLKSQIIEFQEKIGYLKPIIENCNSKILEKKTNQDLISKINNDIEKLKEKQLFLEKEIEHLLQKRMEIENRKINFNLDEMTQEFENKKNEYSSLYSENKELNSRIKNNNVIAEILSDSGIKTFFLKKMIPILNSKINEFLNRFELPIRLVFNEMMEESINVIGSDLNVSYFSFSEGEKKRIDMSILLSFIEVTKIVSNWNCNILMLDEILDTATDSNGLDKMVYLIKGMTYDNKNLCIYVISHRVDDNYLELFNQVLLAKKVNDFSRVIIETS